MSHSAFGLVLTFQPRDNNMSHSQTCAICIVSTAALSATAAFEISSAALPQFTQTVSLLRPSHWSLMVVLLELQYYNLVHQTTDCDRLCCHMPARPSTVLLTDGHGNDCFVTGYNGDSWPPLAVELHTV